MDNPMHPALENIYNNMQMGPAKVHAFMIFTILSGYYNGILPLEEFQKDIKVILDATKEE